MIQVPGVGLLQASPVRRGSNDSPPIEFQEGRGIEVVMRSAADAANAKYRKQPQLLLVVLRDKVCWGPGEKYNLQIPI